jgi:hypothetical protein
MISTAISAQEFFNSANNKQRATLVGNSRFVKEGEKAVFNFGFNLESRVEEDGWYVPLPVGKVFEDFAELEEHVVNAQQVKRFELPADVKVKKVKTGETYVANVGFLVETSVDYSGYLIKTPGENGSRFIGEAQYVAVFGDKQPVEGQVLVAIGDPFQCVVLEQEVTFDFIQGECTAPAGSILYENKEDEDGYTVVSPIHFLRDHVVLQ